MTLAFVGIFCNLMVVSTIRDHDDLQESTFNLLLANIAISNLIISFLVKPISAVYVSYSMTTGLHSGVPHNMDRLSLHYPRSLLECTQVLTHMSLYYIFLALLNATSCH